MPDWLYHESHKVGRQSMPLTPVPYQTQPGIPYHPHRNYELGYASARPRVPPLSLLARRPRGGAKSSEGCQNLRFLLTKLWT